MKLPLLFISLLGLFPLVALAQNPELSNFLNSDGSLAPNSGRGMSFDAHNYRMWLGENGEPHFAEAASHNEPLVKKDYWDSLWQNVHSYNDEIDNGVINAIAVDGDNLYLAGDFEYFNDVRVFHIVNYNRTTGTWSPLGTGLGNTVNALAIRNGILYAGGYFTTDGFAGTQSLLGIASWDGFTWTTVSSGVNGYVNSIAFIDTSIIIGGNFTTAGTTTVSNIAKWNGHSWDDMNGGLTSQIRCLLVTGDSVFAGGNFYSNSRNLKKIALYSAGAWQSLGEGLDGDVYTMAFFHGQLWVGGDFYYTSSESQTLYNIASWDGTNWNGFGTDPDIGTRGTGIIQSILAVGDSLYIGGNFSTIAGIKAHGVVKWAGGHFADVSGGVYGEVRAIGLFNGSLYAGGMFSRAGSLPVKSIAKIASGDQWQQVEGITGAYGGFNETYTLAVASTNQYIFVGGVFTMIQNKPMNHIAAWDKVNRKWIALGNGVDNNVFCITIQGTNVYIGGPFNYAGDTLARHIAYWDMNAGLWHSMGQGVTRYTSAIAANGTGIYASVFFPNEGNGLNNYIGRWDGTSWHQMDGAIRGYVNAMAIKDSTLYIGGTIASIDGLKYNNIAFHDQTGWSPLGSFNNEVRTILVVSDTEVFAGGYFTIADGNTVNGIARWNGQNWNDLNGGLSNGSLSSFVAALAWNGSSLYVGGAFTTAGSVPANYLAKWDSQNWTSVTGGTGYNVYGLALDPSSLAVVGGFTRVNSTFYSYRFAILHFGSAGVEDNSSQNISLQNYPNPFTTSTTISYSVPKESYVRLEIYDILGKKVKTLLDEYKAKGMYEILLDASTMPAGMYFCRYEASGITDVRWLNLIK